MTREPPNPPPHVYAGVGINRASERRKDSDWLEARRRDHASWVLVLKDLEVAIIEHPEGPRAFRTNPTAINLGKDDDAIFLGLDEEERAIFAVGAGATGIDHADLLTETARFADLRSVGPMLPATESGMLAYARALANWHRLHRHCGADGALTESIEAGHARRCTHCGRLVFPRTDPAVIMLVTRGDQCILGRSAHFKTGMYSTLAGFVEPGETLEMAVRREVQEEVGIVIGDVRYRSSQPWPFPQSLMLGFRAEALSDDLNIEPDEIEDARWFDRADLRDPDARPVQFPNADSIARWLIEEWLAEA
ncbi:NAD+ diphosphatase [Arboricoccus pini]|uniref:NAD(+) diphosphatase n=1 Tax=Arboricoccus pini TaxID=1963835 RepID=A0A212QX49_9PROT|nr:NAD(+) diphosphatase [Arboricoccus pini]SNB64328.1 NAD+ diphosphatase [Arboricoccus pini]